MRTRTFLILLLALAALWVLLGAAGCARQEHDGLRFAIASAPVTLDPRFATDATSARIDRLLYEHLVDFDDALRPVPALARWERITPTHYRFTLAREAVFHDGSALDSADVKATYDSILDPQTASPHRATISMIARIETPDARTVDFHLARPDALFPGYLVIGILPSEGIARGHAFNKQPVGSGPFALQEWPEEGRLVLRRLRDGRRAEFLKVADPTVRALKLLRGEVDMLQNDMPSELILHLERRGMRVLRQRGSNFSYLGFNLDDPVTGRIEVRRAIAHALDRDAVIHHVFGGAARPAASLLPGSHWAGNPDLTPYPYDPSRARAQLRLAGYGEGQRVALTYKTSNDPFRIRLATVIQQQLAQVGVDVEIRSYDWGTFYGDIKAGAFQMFSLAWVGVKTPDIFRYVFHSGAVPPEGANRGRYRNAEVDRLIEAAEASEDEGARVAAYRELQRVVNEELPYVPLWYEDHVFVARDGIQGYRLSHDGNFDGLVEVEKTQR